ncbi:host specificity protein J [Shumkonia mesophila]|uniref:host specificity protein J n=1 Tax=Shumkonia mesophila TaxID=2838854 RepID=UPI00293486C0|nr:phage tail protein [Shumkonia mesophila]
MADPISRRGPRPQAFGRKGGKGGGGEGRVAQEAPNTLRTKNVARILDLLGEGAIGGLVDGLKSVIIDGTPVEAADGSANFSGITIRERLGSPDQDPIPGFDEVEEEVAIGVRVKADAPVIRGVTDADVDAVRIKIQFPALVSQNRTNGDLLGTSVAFTVRRRPAGGEWETAHDVAITDKNTAPAELGYRVAKPAAAGSWEWGVFRSTPDSEDSALKNETWVSSVTLLTESKLSYPYSAVIGIEADAEQFGNTIPGRSYDVWGLADFQIPSNYDPRTRAYDGLWDGTFKVDWTDNPAWGFYNICQRELWGLGRFVSAAQLSQLKWDLYEIGRYCDGLVPDGFGGQEPRFTMNGVIEARRDAIAVLATLTSVFRGMAFWGAGGMMASCDRPLDPVRLVTNANVVGGRFERPGSKLRARPTAAIVAWNDPADVGRVAFEVVEDGPAIRRFGYKPAQVAAFLCNSRGQARRVGAWLLASQDLDPIIFAGGEDLTDLRPGNVIRIRDAEEVGARWGGRLAAATVSSLTLDAAVDLEAGVSYGVSVRLPDGGLADRVVANGPGAATVLTLSEDLPAVPVEGAVWMMWSGEIEPEYARVITVAEKGNGVTQFDCLTYRPGLHEAVDDAADFQPARTSLVPTGPLPTPQDLDVTEYLYQAGPGVAGGASVSWRPPTDVRVRWIEIQVKRPTETFAPLGFVTAPPVELRDVGKGAYTVRARCVDGFGRRGPWATLSKTLWGLAALPVPPTGLSLARAGGLAILTWSPHPGLDVRIGGDILIRHSATGGGIAKSTSIMDPLPGAAVQAVAPLRAGTYYVLARDSGKRVSETAAEVSTDQAAVLLYSPVGVMQIDPDWIGAHDGTVAGGGSLRLAGAGAVADMPVVADVGNFGAFGGIVAAGTFTPAGGLDLGSVRRVRLTALLDVLSVNLLDTIRDRVGAVRDWPTFLGAPAGEADARVEIRTTPDDPAGDPAWSAWEALQAGEYETRGVEPRIRLTTTNPNQQITIDQFRVEAAEVT